MVWDAIEPENLVEAEPEQVLQHGFLDAIGRFSANQPIDGLLPAYDAINQLLA